MKQQQKQGASRGEAWDFDVVRTRKLGIWGMIFQRHFPNDISMNEKNAKCKVKKNAKYMDTTNTF